MNSRPVALEPTRDRQSLRPCIADLQRSAALLRVQDEVDIRFEISAYLAELADGPAVMFDSIRGHGLRAVGNLLNSRSRIARALGLAPDAMQARLIEAITAGVPPRVVPQGPCQDVVIDRPDLGRELPAPWFFPQESGRYITAGVVIARDRSSGRGNASYARLKLLERDDAMVGIAPNHHLAVMARAAKARGEKLDIAVTIGNHPAVLLAAALYLRLGDDELDVAGALLGEPVELVACRSIDLAAPAQCEIVLEGTLDVDQLHEEGPVSEYHGMHQRYGAGAVARFHCMTRRRDALFQVIEPGHFPEHTLIGGVAIAAGLARALRDAAVPVKEVAVGHGGCGRLNAVVSLASHRPGEPRKAMFVVWGAVNLIKSVTVVDDDVDPWDVLQVEWAVATRLRAERDLLIAPGVRADRSEPLEQQGVVARMGLDATRKGADRADWSRALPPEDVMQRVRSRLARRPDAAP